PRSGINQREKDMAEDKFALTRQVLLEAIRPALTTLAAAVWRWSSWYSAPQFRRACWYTASNSVEDRHWVCSKWRPRPMMTVGTTTLIFAPRSRTEKNKHMTRDNNQRQRQ